VLSYEYYDGADQEQTGDSTITLVGPANNPQLALYTAETQLEETLAREGVDLIGLPSPVSETWQPVSGGTNVPDSTFNQPQTGAAGFALSASSATTAGSAALVTVTALDASGNILTGYLGTVYFSSSDQHAGLPAGYTFTAADQGSHTFVVVLQTAGNQTVTATDYADGIDAQASLPVVSAAAASFVLGAPTAAVAGAPASLTVTAYDAYGNVVTGYTGTVSFSSSDRQAGLPASYTFTPTDQGSHTFTMTLDSAGNQSVTASDSSGAISGQASLLVLPAGFTYQNGTLTVTGTSGNDTFRFTAGSVFTVTLNGTTVTFSPSQLSAVVFTGGGGSDTASLIGTGSGETAMLAPGFGQLQGNGYTVRVSASTIGVQGGAGEVAYFTDSAGNDTFIASPGNSYLYGTGFWNQVVGFGAVVAGSSGGNDRATLYGQDGASFLGTPTNSQLTGPGLWEQASGFKVVVASAVGNERAVLYGSAGNDTLVGAPSYLYLTGSSYWEQASGFAVVFAVGNGGSDTATLYDSAGNDTFSATPGSSYLSGSGYWNQVYGFGVVFASDSGQGNDRAYLYGSAGNDTFVGMPSTSYLYGTGYWEQVYGFHVVLAVGGGGSDVAQLYDSAGNDTFVGTPGNSTLSGAGFWNQVFGFAQVFAVANAGGTDTATFYDSAGNDSFVGQGAVASLSGSGYLNWSTGFASVTAVSNSGGTDTADLSTLDFLFAEIGPWLNHQH
jgi:hypothetical protein